MQAPAHFQKFAQAAKGALDQLRQEFMSIRTSRVSPSMLERIKVLTYGAEMPINQVASVGSLDARTLEVRPWDPKVAGDIEKAIQKSDLGVTPTNDGTVLRIAFPALTEERRKDYIKVAKNYAEAARVKVRNARRDAQEEAIQKPLKEKKITEDEKFRRQHELDGLTNKLIQDVDSLLAAKEKEILEV
ncbi:MAG: ribosome recycling factor [Elusimicrobia bacterium]|nr:ribosome recycling factor [Elusimicrobiota bacterium]